MTTVHATDCRAFHAQQVGGVVHPTAQAPMRIVSFGTPRRDRVLHADNLRRLVKSMLCRRSLPPIETFDQFALSPTKQTISDPRQQATRSTGASTRSLRGSMTGSRLSAGEAVPRRSMLQQVTRKPNR